MGNSEDNVKNFIEIFTDVGGDLGRTLLLFRICS